MIKQGDKKKILELANLETNERREKSAESREKYLAAQAGNRNPALKFAEDVEDETFFKLQRIIEHADQTAKSSNMKVDESDYKWISDEILTHIGRRKNAGVQGIEHYLHSRGRGKETAGPIRRFEYEIAGLRLKTLRKIEMAKIERSISSRGGNYCSMIGNAIDLKPNFLGIGIDLKKLLKGWFGIRH